MAWNRVQSAGNNSFASSVGATFTSNVSAGNKIIAVVASSFSTVPTSVTDAASNSWISLASKATSTGSVWLYALDVPAGDVGTKPTITALWGSSNGQSILVQEVSGLLAGTSGILDGSAVSLSGTATATGSPAYSSTAANEYLVCVYGDDDGNLTVTPVSGTPDAANQGTFSDAAMAYQNSTGGLETTGFTGANTGGWALLTVAFKLAAPPAGGIGLLPQPGALRWRGQLRRQPQQLPPPTDRSNQSNYLPVGMLPQPGALKWQGSIKRRVQQTPPPSGPIIGIIPVQIAPAQFSSTSVSGSVNLTFNNPVTPGNTIVVLFASGETTDNPTVTGITVGGSAGNFVSAEALNTNGTNYDSEIWYDPNVQVSGASSVVVNYANGVGASAGVYATAYEVPGVLSVDKTSGQALTSGATWSSLATSTTVAANEIFFGSAMTQHVAAATGSWVTQNNSLGATRFWIGGYQTALTTGTATFSGTMASGLSTSVVATFKQVTVQLATSVSFPAVTVNAGSGVTASDGGMVSVSFDTNDVNAGSVVTASDGGMVSVAFPAPIVSAGGNASITTTALTTSVIFDTNDVNAGEVATTTALNASVSFPAPTITATSNASITTSVLTASVSFPAETVNAGEVITTSALNVSASFPSPVVSTGETVTTSALDTSVLFPAPTVNISETATTAALSTSVAFPAPTVNAGSSVTTSALNTSVSFPSAVVNAGNVVTTSVLNGTVAFPSPAISASEVATLSVLDTSVSFPAVSVNTGETVTTAALDTSVSFPAPSVSAGGNASITTTVLNTSVSFPAETVNAGETITTAVLAATTAFPAVTANAGTVATTSALNGSVTFPAVTVHAGEVITTSALAGSVSFPAPTIFAGGNANITTSVLNTSVAFPASVLHAGSTVTPSNLSLSVSFPAVVVSTGSNANLTPSTLITAVSYINPAVATGSRVTPSLLATSASFPVPVVRTFSVASLNEETLGGSATSSTFYGTAANAGFNGTATSETTLSGNANYESSLGGTGTQELMSTMINLEAYVNNDTPFYLAVTNVVNNQVVPQSIAGYTATVYVKANSSASDGTATTYTSGSGLVITSAYLGEITWTLPHSATTAAGTFWWRLDLAASGNVSTVMYGNLYILAV